MADQLGKWAFIVGAVLALIMGIGVGVQAAWAAEPWLKVVLVLAGLIVGFVNISIKEVQGFLVASLALLVANTANLNALFPGLDVLGAILAGFVANVLIVVAPAALVVSLRAIYGYAAE